ncbi:MAG: motility associated factor glycosyltransferase family protein [Phycisphaeraceae bacterium]
MTAPLPGSDSTGPSSANAQDASGSDPTILAKNLAALARRDPALAKRIAEAEPAVLQWEASKAGPWVASLERDGRRLTLASRYDPEKEAGKLLGEIDRREVACVALLGMGVGHHVRKAVADAGPHDAVVVYEPELGVLRAVLEKMDHSRWLGDRRVQLFAADAGRSRLTQKLEPIAATVIQGARVIVHPPSRQRAGQELARFNEAFTDTLAYCRTTIATALVNASRTCRNLVSNLPWYAAGATTNELKHAAKGKPAVLVAAGPSLVKNVDLLADPDVRRQVVVISTQTTLRPLLDRGIRPDYVTALDYSPISSRFYEGLPDLDDVALVAEPKAHNAILRGFPGPIRIAHNELNDKLLGELARPIEPLKSGATVAHLSFYLAQHLGCDPIVFIGQDLGFSDGLYYAPGTAVHRVWSSELGPFNTLEMMEWQRVVRMRGHLRRAEDIDGKPMFTDEQMVTYLKQFERDFEDAPQTVIDATEGGMPKEHTIRMPLREAIETYASGPIDTLPRTPRALDLDRLGRLESMLTTRREQLEELRKVTARTLPILEQMKKHQRDGSKMKRLFEQLQSNQRRVEGDLRPAFETATQINTVGSYRRKRADRVMTHTAKDPLELQKQQLQRDHDNLEWLGDACVEALEILDDAITQLPALVEDAQALHAHGRPIPQLDRPTATAATAAA